MNRAEGGKVGLIFYFNLPPKFPDSLPAVH